MHFHWKAELNNSVLRRVLNVPMLVASRVDDLRLFQKRSRSCVWQQLISGKEYEEMLSFRPQVTWRYVIVQQTVEIRWLFESSHVECDESDLEHSSQCNCLSNGFELAFHAACSTTRAIALDSWSLPIFAFEVPYRRELLESGGDETEGDHLIRKSGRTCRRERK